METTARRWVRPEDLVWVLLFAAFVFFGPDKTPETTAILVALGLFQLIEPKLPFFMTLGGTAVAFVCKMALCFLLLGWTDGIQSSYYPVLLLPVISAATALGLTGTMVATALTCGTYLSFLAFLKPNQYILPEDLPYLYLRALIFPIVGFVMQQQAESKRAETRRYQEAAEQLTEANKNLKEAEAAMRRSERLAALGQLSAGLAHELRNPLGTMKASAEMLAKNVGSQSELARELTTFISSEVDRTNSLITRFLDFARPLALRLETEDVTQVMDRAIKEIEQHNPPLEVVIYRNYTPGLSPIPVDAELMERVFYNLLLNAAQASPPQGAITVKTREVENAIEVAVIDRGSGIEPKHLDNIFNPFFTTKPTGVGLGLAIVSKIVDEHRGKIAIESEPGSGTVFRVYLPMGA